MQNPIGVLRKSYYHTSEITLEYNGNLTESTRNPYENTQGMFVEYRQIRSESIENLLEYIGRPLIIHGKSYPNPKGSKRATEETPRSHNLLGFHLDSYGIY